MRDDRETQKRVNSVGDEPRAKSPVSAFGGFGGSGAGQSYTVAASSRKPSLDGSGSGNKQPPPMVAKETASFSREQWRAVLN